MAYHPFRNLGLKFLSTLVAILLWLVVAGERVVERVMRAPVEFQNLPAGLELVGNAKGVAFRSDRLTLPLRSPFSSSLPAPALVIKRLTDAIRRIRG